MCMHSMASPTHHFAGQQVQLLNRRSKVAVCFCAGCYCLAIGGGGGCWKSTLLDTPLISIM